MSSNSSFSSMLRGRGLHRLAVSSLAVVEFFPLDLDFLEAAAALPVDLYLRGPLSCARSYLERLADGPAEVGTLWKLVMDVDEISETTLLPLVHLTGLTHLTLPMYEPTVVSWPGLRVLRTFHVRYEVQSQKEDWWASLLATLAASPTRYSLEELRLCDPYTGGMGDESAADAAVAAAAPRLRALRRLTMFSMEWTLARGTVVGKAVGLVGEEGLYAWS